MRRVSFARHRTGDAWREDVLPALGRVWARAAVAGADGIDDARVDLPQSRIAEVEPLHHPGAEVVHDNVGSFDEVAHHLPSGLAPEVHLDAPLVAVQAEEHRVVGACRILDRPAREIPGAGALDLDDIGAEIAKRLGADGAKLYLGEIDDADALGRQRHQRSSSAVAIACSATGRSSPGSAPCERNRRCTAATSTLRTATSASSARAAATPAACPMTMQGPISRLLRCAIGVAE